MDHAQMSGSILYGPRQVRASALEQRRTDSNCVRAYREEHIFFMTSSSQGQKFLDFAERDKVSAKMFGSVFLSHAETKSEAAHGRHECGVLG